MKKVIFCFAITLITVNDCVCQEWKVYRDSAELYKSKAEFDMAEKAFTHANDAIPADSVLRPMYLQFLISMGSNYSMGGQSGNFIPVLEASKKRMLKQGGDLTTAHAFVCNYLGNLYTNTGKFDTAQSLHLKAKEIREKLVGKKDPSYAQSCNNLGALYSDMGRFSEAEPLLLEAKAIREKIKPEKKATPYAITCVALANLYRNIGQYEKAEQLYMEAKEIRGIDSAAKQSEDYAASCNILADLYSYMNQTAKAEALYLEAKQVRQKINDNSYNYGQTCNNLANLYQGLGRFKEAEALALEAKAIYEKQLPEGHASRTIQLNNLGELYQAMGVLDKAEAYFLAARKDWEKRLGKEHHYFINNSEALAKVYWQSNQTAKAADLFRETAKSKYHTLNRIFSFTNEEEQQGYLNNITGSNAEYYSFYYKNKIPLNGADAFTLSLHNRNLILSSAQKTRQVIYTSGDASTKSKFDSLLTLKQQLAKLYSLGFEAKPEALKTVEDKAAMLEKELSRLSAGFRQSQAPPAWQTIQQNLRPSETAIEFISFQLYNGQKWTDSTIYAALLLKKTGTPVFIPLFEKNSLDQLLVRNTDDLTAVQALYSDGALFKLIWQPLQKHLAGISRIYAAPAGNLFKIAFAAIPINNHEVLGDKYQLLQVNTTATINSSSRSFISSKDRLALYGGINYDADTALLKASVVSYQNNNKNNFEVNGLRGGKTFQFLPATKKEVEAIKIEAQKIDAPAKLHSGAEGTEESIYQLNGNASPSVLHIATHGFFFPDPGNQDSTWRRFETSGKVFKQSANPLMRSGLLFAGANNKWANHSSTEIEDGILTAYEVSNLYLPHTKLVVLSACETALGDVQGSEGVYGLQRAFKMAGAENLVMSLWKVPDAETAEFMQVFYWHLFNRKTINEAFFTAQTAMKNKYRREPYKWAAWVLIK
jgi:CHAT domain-containing protein